MPPTRNGSPAHDSAFSGGTTHRITLAGHGEYYPTNVIYQNRTSRPADWQSTAVAVGQIDLAALTQNWPRQMIRKLTLEYKRSRWPKGEPDEFDRLFGVARVYMILRWLGDPNLASPAIRRSILSRRTRQRSTASRLLVRKYRRFIELLNSEAEWYVDWS